jgi:hypothetical protein
MAMVANIMLAMMDITMKNIRKFTSVTPEFLLLAKKIVVDDGYSFNVLSKHVVGGARRLRALAAPSDDANVINRGLNDDLNDIIEYSKLRTRLNKQQSFYIKRQSN